MSGNVTKYQNGTALTSDDGKEAGLSLFQIMLLSFTLMSSIALVFSLVCFMLRKRALEEFRHRLVPLYHFDPGECEDWEDELLEDSKKEILGSDRKIYEFFSLRPMSEGTDIYFCSFYFLKAEDYQLRSISLMVTVSKH